MVTVAFLMQWGERQLRPWELSTRDPTNTRAHWGCLAVLGSLKLFLLLQTFIHSCEPRSLHTRTVGIFLYLWVRSGLFLLSL